MEPCPVGTIVEYHGSLEHMHGRYEIDEVHDVRQFRPDLAACKDDAYIDEKYPDGKAYVLWPAGVPRKFGLRHLSVSSVRRESITPVEPAILLAE